MKNPMEILAAVLEGTADQQELAALSNALQEDAALREEANRFVELHGQLGVALEGELAREHRVKRVMASLSEADRENFVRGVKRKIVAPRRFVQMLAIAAVLTLSALGIWQLSSQSGDDLMATVTRMENMDWGTQDGHEEGAELEAGAFLNFKAGLVELDLAGRGRLIVEGPARLEFPEAGRAILKRGRIVMRATKDGHGYRVETPQGSIIDLGTEFGVSVGEGGKVETHVLEGHVEAINDDGQRIMLWEDDALRLGPDGGERIDVDSGQFYTQMPPERSKGARYWHWAFDEGEGLVGRATNEGASGKNSDMRFRAMDTGKVPSWVEGIFGSGVSLDGRGGYAESGFPGIGGGKSRTVCFWVKVPADSTNKERYGMLSWGQFRQEDPGGVWQVAANPNRDNGPMGCLRIGVHGGQTVGSTDLRDGQWHHAAVVLYGGSRPNVGTHVLLYVDGEPEEITHRTLRTIYTEVEDTDHGVWMGRNVTYLTSNPYHGHGGFFRGEMDEVYIFEDALDQDEIVRIMENNEVPK